LYQFWQNRVKNVTCIRSVRGPVIVHLKYLTPDYNYRISLLYCLYDIPYHYIQRKEVGWKTHETFNFCLTDIFLRDS